MDKISYMCIYALRRNYWLWVLAKLGARMTAEMATPPTTECPSSLPVVKRAGSFTHHTV